MARDGAAARHDARQHDDDADDADDDSMTMLVLRWSCGAVVVGRTMAVVAAWTWSANEIPVVAASE